MVNTLLQIIFVAAPQATLFTIFSLLLINRFDFINIDEISGKIKFNGKEIQKLVLPVAMLSITGILMRHLRFNLFLAPPVMILSNFFSIIISYKIRKISEVLKLFISVIVWYIVGGTIEFIYSPAILHSAEISIYDIFDSFFINFMTSIPVIVIFFIIDICLITKRKNFLNISVFRSIVQSTSLMGLTLFVLFINFVLMAIHSIFINNKVFASYSIEAQITVSVFIMIFPVLNLGGVWLLIYSVKYKEALDKRIARDKMIEEISVAKERNRMARDVHDTLGHSLTLITKLLEVSKISAKTNPDKIDEQLEKVIRIAKDGIKEIERSVSGTLTEKLLTNDLISSLDELACGFQNKTGVIVKVSTIGTQDALNKEYAFGLYSICQEALTNSLRHGKAKNVAIILRFKSGSVKLSIFDDGKGCKAINKGFGLNGMEQRVSELNGKINYKSDKGQGFIINIEVPKQEINQKLA